MDYQKSRKKKLLKNLPILKMKLTTATQFNEVFDYFFDEFGENRIFLDISVPYPNYEMLQNVLAHSVGRILKTNRIVIRNGVFLHIPEYPSFVHGTGRFNEYLSNFFYFEDIDMGMLAMVLSPNDPMTQLIRFSMRRPGPGGHPSQAN